MKIGDFLGGKVTYIISHLTVLVITVAMLTVLNPAGGKIFALYIGILYLIAAVVPLAAEFRRKREYYNLLVSSFERLDRKNLIAEILPEPDFFEGELLYGILRESNKACLEEINKYKELQEEYREYIEMWVHEIKTPISSSKLIAQNRQSEATDSIAEELDSIESYIEQALFYARSNSVEKDYIIKEISLEKPVYAALKRNSKLLIGSGVSVSAEELDVKVFSDSKWLEFILSQLIINSVKYAKEKDAYIKIEARELGNSRVLKVSDNGIGIAENELARIFDKGFTGTNGRLRGRSTGMGLYICRKLCNKMGISMYADSEPSSGTSISIVFPRSSMTDII